MYAATKAFVLSFTEALRNELQDTNITVTALMPGATDTDFFRKADAEDTKTAQGDLADPSDVALDGYNALMNNDDKVITPAKNRLKAVMMNFMSEEGKAEKARKGMEPAMKKNSNPFLLAKKPTSVFNARRFFSDT